MSYTKCDECHVGRCQPMPMTYMRKLGSHMVILPNAPACRCDMCGRTSFDPGFLQTMQTMMESFARNPQKTERKKTPVTEPTHEWAPVRGSSK
jgi:hypothetical protein